MSVSIKRKSAMKTDVPTSSMPDIIFQLLIFFMVTTVLRQFTGLEVDLPDAKMVHKLENKRQVSTIWIDRENRVNIDDVSVDKLSDLRSLAYNKLLEEPALVISLKVDKEAEMGRLIDVQEELRKANTLRVVYSAIPKA
ncbi:MAG TPA: biopolymer transporter ExbD [Calditrichia bacterium]|nr:biopolymer transporter ExbD [Calditrichota bacterium]HQU73115.1 biopolymer transporter ExbD [Calditrichia bacterium]HQV31826.1 biopolymer transporter ExbD [Calditrichia bacterium]